MRDARLSVAALVISALAGCGPGTPPPSPLPPADLGQPTAETPPTQTGDAPEISRSVGAEGGVVVLWPRIVRSRKEQGPLDDETKKIVAALQQRARDAAGKAMGGAPIDVRPEPERVCPRAGCKAITVGVLFTRTETACAVMALVAPAGPSPAKIVPWAGRIRVDKEMVPFRDPPERQIGVEDYVPCAKVLDELGAREADVVAAIRAAK